jgi:L-ascorbate metabolism protein UlaG (beta-lactamase superfamily)
MGGIYTMDEEEAVEAAKAINAKFIVPMHYKNLLGKVGSERIEKELKKRVNALILKEVQEPTYSFNNR